LTKLAFAVAVIAMLVLGFVPIVSLGAAHATSPGVQSTISVYLACNGSVAFAEPGAPASCVSGNYTGIYTGISQDVISNQTSVFFLAMATGGVKVTFSLTDVTTDELLIKGVGYGAISGGTCSSADSVVPSSTTVSTNVVSSGDTLRAALNTTFTGTGTPTFCSGGNSSTLITLGTTVVGGQAQPPLSNLLRAGNPHQSTLFGFDGVAETYVNTGTSAFTAVVMGVVKNSSGSTIDVLISSASITPGANVTAFLKFDQYPSGTYTVDVLVTTSSNVPISTVRETTVTV
jgi:hypothetical protein